jgi:hypothetical protein
MEYCTLVSRNDGGHWIYTVTCVMGSFRWRNWGAEGDVLKFNVPWLC